MVVGMALGQVAVGLLLLAAVSALATRYPLWLAALGVGLVTAFVAVLLVVTMAFTVSSAFTLVVASQLATAQNQFSKAETYLQKAIDLNYSAPNLSAYDVRMNMAELYFSQERFAEGVTYISQLIAARKAEGQPVNPNWYRRGVQIAYNNELVPQIYDFVQGWVIDVPTPENWRDAVNLTRNLNDYDGPVLLDLLRLGKRVGTLKEKNDYVFYIEAADTRRLPMEVKSVIEEANATGAIPKGSDPWVDEQLATANGLIAEDRAALPTLERDANAPTARLRTVLAAGDTFLSYGEYAKAASFYERSLTMPEVDRNLALTRLGIAQIGAGNTDAARETLSKVDGPRSPIAKLWSAYASQSAAPAAPAVASSSRSSGAAPSSSIATPCRMMILMRTSSIMPISRASRSMTPRTITTVP